MKDTSEKTKGNNIGILKKPDNFFCDFTKDNNWSALLSNNHNIPMTIDQTDNQIMLSSNEFEFPQNQEKTDNNDQSPDNSNAKQQSIKLHKELLKFCQEANKKGNPSINQEISNKNSNNISSNLQSTFSNKVGARKKTLTDRQYGQHDNNSKNKNNNNNNISISQKSRTSYTNLTSKKHINPSYYKGFLAGNKQKNYNDKYDNFYYKLLQAEENKLNDEVCQDDNILKSKMVKIDEMMNAKDGQKADNDKSIKRPRLVQHSLDIHGSSRRGVSNKRKVNEANEGRKSALQAKSPKKYPIKFNSDLYVKDIQERKEKFIGKKILNMGNMRNQYLKSIIREGIDGNDNNETKSNNHTEETDNIHTGDDHHVNKSGTSVRLYSYNELKRNNSNKSTNSCKPHSQFINNNKKKNHHQQSSSNHTKRQLCTDGYINIQESSQNYLDIRKSYNTNSSTNDNTKLQTQLQKSDKDDTNTKSMISSTIKDKIKKKIHSTTNIYSTRDNYIYDNYEDQQQDSHQNISNIKISQETIRKYHHNQNHNNPHSHWQNPIHRNITDRSSDVIYRNQTEQKMLKIIQNRPNSVDLLSKQQQYQITKNEKPCKKKLNTGMVGTKSKSKRSSKHNFDEIKEEPDENEQDLKDISSNNREIQEEKLKISKNKLVEIANFNKHPIASDYSPKFKGPESMKHTLFEKNKFFKNILSNPAQKKALESLNNVDKLDDHDKYLKVYQNPSHNRFKSAEYAFGGIRARSGSRSLQGDKYGVRSPIKPVHGITASSGQEPRIKNNILENAKKPKMDKSEIFKKDDKVKSCQSDTSNRSADKKKKNVSFEDSDAEETKKRNTSREKNYSQLSVFDLYKDMYLTNQGKIDRTIGSSDIKQRFENARHIGKGIESLITFSKN